MGKDRTVSYADVLTQDLYCHCGTWIYCPEMNGTKLDEQQNEIACVGEGCAKSDDNGEYMECPECGTIYYLTK